MKVTARKINRAAGGDVDQCRARHEQCRCCAVRCVAVLQLQAWREPVCRSGFGCGNGLEVSVCVCVCMAVCMCVLAAAAEEQ